MKNNKLLIGCSITAAICFGIVSYGHFYRGRISYGWIFALLCLAQALIALSNLLRAGKIRRMQQEQETPKNGEAQPTLETSQGDEETAETVATMTVTDIL